MKTNACAAIRGIEPLEARIAPSTIFGLTPGNVLVRFDSATPGTLADSDPITGLGANETLRGIDFRPATGDLVGVTVTTGSANNSLLKTYTIDPDTAVATLVGPTAAALAGAGDVPGGFDFNPTVDRIRSVNTSGENARLNPNIGALAGNDTDLTFTAPATGPIIAEAYDRNFANTPMTTLYGIDRGASRLVLQGGIDGTPSPNGGAVTGLATLGFTLKATNDGGFDIETGTNIAYAALTDAADNLTRLYTIDLGGASNVATPVGLIDTGATGIYSIAVALPPVAVTITGGTATYTDEDGDVVTVKASTGTFEADDFRFARLTSGTQLRLLDLSDDGVEFQGASLTITAKKGPAGDGLANIGFIKARDTAALVGVDLGTVSVQGDLGLIDAGNATSTDTALKSLTVRSMGRYGLLTMAGSVDLQSDIFGALGPVKIADDMLESSFSVTATVDADARTGAITIGGSLSGAATANTGRLFSEGDMGAVKIGDDLVGGTGNESGKILALGKLASVTIGGSVFGGEGDLDVVLAQAGQIVSLGDMGAVKIGAHLRGGGGNNSGAIYSGTLLTSITVGGSVFGGEALGSAEIFTPGNLGPVKIGGSLFGGANAFAGSIFGSAAPGAKLANVTIGGSLIGGSGTLSGNVAGGLGTVKIGGDVVGGSGTASGALGGTGNFVGVQNLTIGGSLLGGTGAKSGAIDFQAAIGSVKIGHDIIGASINGTDLGINGSGAIQGLRIDSVTVGGSIITGTDNSTNGALTANASIRAFNDIGSITVKGSLIGNVQTNGTTPVIISARGQAIPAATGDLAIGKLTIGGRVERAQILAGYSQTLVATNGNASIGAVSVGGDWAASDLVAGIQDDADTALDDAFGDADDQLIAAGASRIASIMIKGRVLGSPTAGDTFGFLAKTIGSFSALGFKAPLTAGADGTIKLTPLTADVIIREF